MYDELVKRLREAAKMSEALAVLLPHSEGNATAKLYKEAADAIEELMRRCEQFQYMPPPAWIPVTERLPETGEYVLVRYKNNDMAVACVFDRDENFTFWRAQTDEGWCSDCDTEPTHWMPLPQPPEEA